jgi:hypothetical protein
VGELADAELPGFARFFRASTKILGDRLLEVPGMVLVGAGAS